MLLCLCLFLAVGLGAVYSIDPVLGSSSNDGVSAPWKDYTSVVMAANNKVFLPGDSILFNAAYIHDVGRMYFDKGGMQSGTAGSPITIGSYGIGRAVLNSTVPPGTDASIVIQESYYVIQDLVLIGKGTAPFSTLGANYDSFYECGLKIFAASGATLQGYTIRNLDVSLFPTGVLILTEGSPIGHISNVAISGLNVKNCSAFGLVIGDLGGLLDSAPNATYSVDNVSVTSSVFDTMLGISSTNGGGGPTGTGIYLRHVRKARVSASTVSNCGGGSTDNFSYGGITCVSCADTTIESNVVNFVRKPSKPSGSGGVLLGAITIGTSSVGCIVQRNFIHTCDGAGIMFVNPIPASTAVTPWGDNVARFNIVQRCGTDADQDQGGITITLGETGNSSTVHSNTIVAQDGLGIKINLLMPRPSNVLVHSNVLMTDRYVSAGTTVPAPAPLEVKLEYCLFYGSASATPFFWGNVAYTSLAAFNTGFPLQATNSWQTNPFFKGPTPEPLPVFAVGQVVGVFQPNDTVGPLINTGKSVTNIGDFVNNVAPVTFIGAYAPVSPTTTSAASTTTTTTSSTASTPPPVVCPSPQCPCTGASCTLTGNVTLSPGQTLTVPAGSTLQVTGNLVVGSGTVQVSGASSGTTNIVVNGALVLSLGATLVVTSYQTQTFTVASATSISGTFSAIRVNSSNSCVEVQGVQPSYTATTVSVTVSEINRCGGALSTGAIVGIAVGGAALAAAVIIAIVLVQRRMREHKALASIKRSTAFQMERTTDM